MEEICYHCDNRAHKSCTNNCCKKCCLKIFDSCRYHYVQKPVEVQAPKIVYPTLPFPPSGQASAVAANNVASVVTNAPKVVNNSCKHVYAMCPFCYQAIIGTPGVDNLLKDHLKYCNPVLFQTYPGLEKLDTLNLYRNCWRIARKVEPKLENLVLNGTKEEILNGPRLLCQPFLLSLCPTLPPRTIGTANSELVMELYNRTFMEENQSVKDIQETTNHSLDIEMEIADTDLTAQKLAMMEETSTDFVKNGDYRIRRIK